MTANPTRGVETAMMSHAVARLIKMTRNKYSLLKKHGVLLIRKLTNKTAKGICSELVLDGN